MGEEGMPSGVGEPNSPSQEINQAPKHERQDAKALMQETMNKLRAANEKYGGKLLLDYQSENNPDSSVQLFQNHIRDGENFANYLLVTTQGFKIIRHEGASLGRIGYIIQNEKVNRDAGTTSEEMIEFREGRIVTKSGEIGPTGGIYTGRGMDDISRSKLIDEPDPNLVGEIMKVNKDTVEAEIAEKQRAAEEARQKQEVIVQSAAKVDEIFGPQSS